MPEEIINKLREAEVAIASGSPIAEADRQRPRADQARRCR